MMQVVMLIVGFVLLVKGADWFVEGAASVAKRMGIPQLVIGLTIVAMGTSMPEAAVSITSAMNGSAEYRLLIQCRLQIRKTDMSVLIHRKMGDPIALLSQKLQRHEHGCVLNRCRNDMLSGTPGSIRTTEQCPVV